jgi:hypothetical protein
MNSPCTTNQLHCENCGSSDPENVDPFNDDLGGYTGCCNELMTDQRGCKGHHSAR